MSSRKLTKQQSRRIATRRQAHNGGVEESDSRDDASLGPELEGLVISHYGAKADIENPSTREVTRCHLRANLGTIVTGDRVMWRAGDKAGVVVSIFPRLNELQRPDNYGKLKPVAANITRALIVIAPEPEPHANLIDRYLVVAENLGVEPVIVVNKADSIPAGETSAVSSLIREYRDLGYVIYPVSSHTGAGLEDLQRHLATGVSIFVGQSGVGKSSIIQALLPDEEIKIGDLSEQVRKGRHTTTHARLYHFPTGGDCIDSPGIREFGLWHLSAVDVAIGFREFRPHIANCRFRNCSHLTEPNCGLRQALQNRQISAERFASFRQIVDTLADVSVHQAGHNDVNR